MTICFFATITVALRMNGVHSDAHDEAHVAWGRGVETWRRDEYDGKTAMVSGFWTFNTPKATPFLSPFHWL